MEYVRGYAILREMVSLVAETCPFESGAYMVGNVSRMTITVFWEVSGGAETGPKAFVTLYGVTSPVGPKRCQWHAGGLRNEPHMDRKLAAMETVEARRNLHPDKSYSGAISNCLMRTPSKYAAPTR
jgi:hypothetical protein